MSQKQTNKGLSQITEKHRVPIERLYLGGPSLFLWHLQALGAEHLPA